MHIFRTRDKPPVYAGLAAVSLMILSGLTLAGTAVVLTVMMPVFVLLIPILLPAVITSSFLATGFFASGSLGVSATALLVWLYKKEKHSRYNMHARGVRPKEAKADKLSGVDKPPEESKPPERDELAEEIKPPAEEDKLSEKDILSERDNPAEEDKSLEGVKHAEEGPSIPEISKVLLAEQNLIGSERCGPSTPDKRSHQILFSMDPTKVQSTFMKEYQKIPRVGAFAYKYFTSRDKKYVNRIHV